MRIRTLLAQQQGAALVTALMLTALSLVIATALMYSVLTGTRVSAGSKRYRSALAAAHGGVEELTKEIIPLLIAQKSGSGLTAAFAALDLKKNASDGCLIQKVTLPTKGWDGTCSQTSDPSDAPDLSFNLKGPSTDDADGFAIFAKIVDTIPGNSDPAGIDYLDQGGSVSGNEEGIHPLHVPAIYNISVVGVRRDRTREKAGLSLLYAY